MKPLNKLRQSYTDYLKAEARYSELTNRFKDFYNAERLFCIECELLTFNEIELMEFEVNNSLSF